MAILAPFFVPQFFDNSGNPLASGKLYTYDTGTTTPKATYTTQAGGTPHANPIILDSAGRVQPGLWLASDAEYRFTLKTSADVTVDEWDDVGGAQTELAASSGSASVGFLQAGAGATARTAQAKMRDWVSVKDFGATGDGATDDTAAINLALATTARHVHFPSGAYVITDALLDGTPALISNQAGRRITCEGYLTATTTVKRALGLYGNDTFAQVNVKGNNKIECGVIAYGDHCVIDGCLIEDLYSAAGFCIGVGTDTAGVNDGVILRNNIIRGLSAPGNAAVGDGNGLCRALYLSLTTNATRESIIENNVVENCEGEEGDAIVVIANNGTGTYYDARAIIRNNVVRNFTRRGVKIQANRCVVENNYFTHTYASAASIPNAITVVDFVQGSDHICRNNTFDTCKYFTQISVFATGAEVWNNFNVERNIFKGVGSETTSATISIASQGSNVFVRDNVFESAAAGRVISLGSITNCVVSGNLINCANDAAARVISLAADVVKAVVRGNVLFSGERQCFIGDDASNAVIVDNHVKCNTPLYRGTTASRNALLMNNTIDGTSGLGSGTLPVGLRYGGNYNFGNQSNFFPGPLSVVVAGGPATGLAGLYVMTGQIVYDASPTAGSYIGWVAMADGLAESITWKQFGAILP